MRPEDAQAEVDAHPPTQQEIAIALRDGFACSALTGILAGGFVKMRLDGVPVSGCGLVAEAAYEYADAMLAARGGQ